MEGSQWVWAVSARARVWWGPRGGISPAWRKRVRQPQDEGDFSAGWSLWGSDMAQLQGSGPSHPGNLSLEAGVKRKLGLPENIGSLLKFEFQINK